MAGEYTGIWSWEDQSYTDRGGEKITTTTADSMFADCHTTTSTTFGLSESSLDDMIEISKQFLTEDGYPANLQSPEVNDNMKKIPTKPTMKLKEMKNTVVQIENQKEYDEILQIYEDGGWKFQFDNPSPKMGYSVEWFTAYKPNYSIWGANNHGCNTISLQEFKKAQGLDFDLKEEEEAVLKPGEYWSSNAFEINGLRIADGEKIIVRECGRLWTRATNDNTYTCKMESTREILLKNTEPADYAKKDLKLADLDTKVEFNVGDRVVWCGHETVVVGLDTETVMSLSVLIERWWDNLGHDGDVGLTVGTPSPKGNYWVDPKDLKLLTKKKPFWKKVGFGAEEGEDTTRVVHHRKEVPIPDGTMTTIFWDTGEIEHMPSKHPTLPFIPSPKPTMDTVRCGPCGPKKTPLQKVRDSKLNPKENALRKAGFKDDCGNFTPAAFEVVCELICEDKRDALVEYAEAIVKKEKEDKKK